LLGGGGRRGILLMLLFFDGGECAKKPLAHFRGTMRGKMNPGPCWSPRQRGWSFPVHALRGDGTRAGGASFIAGRSLPKQKAKKHLYDEFCSALRTLGVTVGRQEFSSKRSVELVNERPGQQSSSLPTNVLKRELPSRARFREKWKCARALARATAPWRTA